MKNIVALFGAVIGIVMAVDAILNDAKILRKVLKNT